MNFNLYVVAVHFALLLQESNMADNFGDNIFPPHQFTECERGMNSDKQYVEVYSQKLNRTLLCDTQTDGGGWIVIQLRENKDMRFEQNWQAYENGFETRHGDFWLGNKEINKLTSEKLCELRIDMVYQSRTYYAKYGNFSVSNQTSNYTLYIDYFEGNVDDDLRYHNKMMFSTPDRDNDKQPTTNCAETRMSGWWFNDCGSVNLNGEFFEGYVFWASLTGYSRSLSSVVMKIRQK